MAKVYTDRGGNILKPGMILKSDVGERERVIRLAGGEPGFERSRYWGQRLDGLYIMPVCGTNVLMDYRLVGGEY